MFNLAISKIRQTRVTILKLVIVVTKSYESREGSSNFRLPTSDFQLPNCARFPLLNTDWVGLKSLLNMDEEVNWILCVNNLFVFGVFSTYLQLNIQSVD